MFYQASGPLTVAAFMQEVLTNPLSVSILIFIMIRDGPLEITRGGNIVHGLCFSWVNDSSIRTVYHCNH